MNIKHQMLVTMLIAINDVLSLNNSKFGGYIDRIYPTDLEIKDATYTVKHASYIDLYL